MIFAGEEELLVGATLIHLMEVATMNSHEIGHLQVEIGHIQVEIGHFQVVNMIAHMEAR